MSDILELKGNNYFIKTFITSAKLLCIFEVYHYIYKNKEFFELAKLGFNYIKKNCF